MPSSSESPVSGAAAALAMMPEMAAAAEVRCAAAVEVGRLDEALPAGVRAVELFAQVAERVPAFTMDLARSQVQLAEVHLAGGEGPRALALAQQAARLLTEEVPQERDEPSARRRRSLLQSKAHRTQRRAEELVWQP